MLVLREAAPSHNLFVSHEWALLRERVEETVGEMVTIKSAKRLIDSDTVAQAVLAMFEEFEKLRKVISPF
ncbi:hypothetical protein GWI33_009314 [Rhynchophorus ferrugineus]|uniref:Uncharacterized protein n=1 Tax=Rhynchophorus ferrugineus TaxID=354439 RepID=A0A834IGZ0_RHYFE|nr:hypothetical protein GWI33_009314 [Rhynchophorus ferrugineus]